MSNEEFERMLTKHDEALDRIESLIERHHLEWQSRFEQSQSDWQNRFEQSQNRFEQSQSDWQNRFEQSQNRFEQSQSDWQNRFEQTAADWRERFAENERLLASILKSQERFERNLADSHGRFEQDISELRKNTARLNVIIERLDQRDIQYQEIFKMLTTELIKTNGRIDRIEAAAKMPKMSKPRKSSKMRNNK
jgi:transketolase